MKLVKIAWIKENDGWKFYQSPVEKTSWGMKDTGFLTNSWTPDQITGFCVAGHEEEWKLRLITEYINKCDVQHERINQTKNMLLELLQDFKEGALYENC